MVRRPPIARLVLSGPLFLLSIVSLVGQDSLIDAASELARKVAPAPGEEIALTLGSLAALQPGEVERARQNLERELARRGARISSAAAGTRVAVTIAESARGQVWTAEIARAAGREVVMAFRAVGETPVAAPPAAVLERRLLLDQEGPILDVALLEGGQMLVLEPDGVTLLGGEGPSAARRSARLRAPGPWPRDLRGRIVAEGAAFRAYLPGVRCSGTTAPALTLDCAEDGGPWPLELGGARLETARNFFVRADLPPFFAAASLADGAAGVFVVAGVDGVARVYDRSFRASGTVPGLGSDLAGIESDCGALVLATRALRDAQNGAVQLFTLVSGRAIPAGAPEEVPGAVTALWSAGDRRHAVVITRDRETGRHAAFRLSVACSR